MIKNISEGALNVESSLFGFHLTNIGIYPFL